MKKKDKSKLVKVDELEREFHVPNSKLTIATDEWIIELFKRRLSKTNGELYAYSAGPMETEGDFGAGWRSDVVDPALMERKIISLNPVKCEAQKSGLTVGESLKESHRLIRERDFEGFRQLAGKIRLVDTNLIVHKTTFIIMHIPLKKPSIGQEKLLAILNKYKNKIIDDLTAIAAEKNRKVSAREREITTKLMLKYFPEEILPEILKAMARGEATGGTSSENQMAVMKDIPVFLVIEKEALDNFSSTWVLDAVLENGRIFDEFADFWEFLDKILARLRQDK